MFNLSGSEVMFRFMRQIGATNIKLVRSFDMWIPSMADPLPWTTLLNTLCKEAADLKQVAITWGADCDFV